MGFTFSLQAVLEHRLTVEEKLQRDYGRAVAELEAVRRRQRAIEDDIARRADEVRRRQRSGLSFARRDLYERWIHAQREAAAQLQQVLDKLAVEVERRRRQLVKAMQDRTVMEELRDREASLYRQEEARGELKVFDEIAVRDYIDSRRRQEKNADLQERIAR